MNLAFIYDSKVQENFMPSWAVIAAMPVELQHA